MTAPSDIARRARDHIAAGNLVLAYDQLHAAIDAGSDDPDLRYLYVLVLARMGLTDRAMDRFQALNLSQIDTTDAGALGARLLKDRAFASTGADRQERFRDAARAYQAVFTRSDDPYPAVNAANLFALAGDAGIAKTLARTVLTQIRQPQSYYDFATLAEAQCILGDHAEAAALLTQACAADGAGISDRAGTYRQLMRLLDHTGADAARRAAIADALRPGMAVHFCGRMFRTDPAVEAPLRAQIDAFLARTEIAAAFGSLACGSDILVAEAMLEAGIPLHVTLPAPPDSFVQHSVRIGGDDWVPRFQACLDRAADCHIVADAFHASEPLSFALSSDVAMGAAARFAEQNAARLHQLAILDQGAARSDVAGTLADTARWKALDRPATILSAGNITRPAPTAPAPRQAAAFTRKPVSILFADFVGFSALPEKDLPATMEATLRAVSGILARFQPHVLTQNTWGDACFVALSDPLAAARLALFLARRLADDSPGTALPEMRISLHHGIGMEMFDPVIARPNVFGQDISRAARIEPVTPPNCVYASQQFVAVAANIAAADLRFDYVGRIALPKDFGEERLYLLSAIEDR
ncbi:tetratricopeptide repeat-containing protein [Aestuariivita boseongensis]|uniref:tetratricopeptide repeat-containing protein n=1 Tax=Aestuariivita boseongensis TaxID=1470562 RepID=UPI0006826D26|nr:tetratricopeptide repeat-containing protein [Aestuariivita boseongensis]